jgi:hypothetical protein
MTDDLQHGRLLVSIPRQRVLRRPNQRSSRHPKTHPHITVLSFSTTLSPMASRLARSPIGKRSPETGDAFVIAPDGSRAGLVWEACDPPYFQETMPIEADRWGVWGVGFRLPMNSRENARRNLESILPELQLRWAEWKARFSGSPTEIDIG